MSALHITNGDSAAGTLRAFLTEPVVITADPLFAGPASDVDDAAWYALRGRHLSDGSAAGAGAVARNLAEWDQALDASALRGNEIVLWFEHDLFDQLLLIRVLDRINRLHGGARDDSRTVLICIDRFPGVEPFFGLGQLSAEQLETLVGTRKPVTRDQSETATRAWRAFRSADPTPMAAVAADTASTAALPFLGDALRRLIEEYPSTVNGLSRSAAQVLRSLTAGPLDGGALFMASQRLEERPFIGDWGLFDVVRTLARGPVPLVTIGPGVESVDLRGRTIAITDAGRGVLDGRQDAVALNGIDEWRGGVRLSGTAPWRWNAASQTLVSLGT